MPTIRWERYFFNSSCSAVIIFKKREQKVFHEQQIKVQEGCPLKCRGGGVIHFVPGDMTYLPFITALVLICFSLASFFLSNNHSHTQLFRCVVYWRSCYIFTDPIPPPLKHHCKNISCFTLTIIKPMRNFKFWPKIIG